MGHTYSPALGKAETESRTPGGSPAALLGEFLTQGRTLSQTMDGISRMTPKAVQPDSLSSSCSHSQTLLSPLTHINCQTNKTFKLKEGFSSKMLSSTLDTYGLYFKSLLTNLDSKLIDSPPKKKSPYHLSGMTLEKLV